MSPVVIVGIGELGAVFARGFLRLGHSVVPVTRQRTMEAVEAVTHDPALVLVAVGERDLHEVLANVPAAWRDRIALLQNELLPRDWLIHEIVDPTVAVVWFEKKATTLVKELLPTPVFGPNARLLIDALDAAGIHGRKLNDGDELLSELVAKNLYILTTNIAGLECGGTVSELLEDQRELAEAVAQDVLSIQAHLSGRELPRDELWSRFVAAVEADPSHACTGRSAPVRLARALAHADVAGLAVPTLRRIASQREGKS